MEVLTCICRGNFPEDQILTNRDASIRLAKSHRLPDKICIKLKQYYEFSMSKPIIVEKQNGLYKSLPDILKKEIKLHCYSRLLMKIPYFVDWPIKVFESLVLLMKEEIFLKHDVVAEVSCLN